MPDIENNAKHQIIALLCIGDLVEHGDRPSPLTPVFGQPFIHHLIKGLEKAGISRFCIGVDHVPGALLAYRDAATAKGADIQFVREPSAIPAHYGNDVRVLVLQTDVFWNPDLVIDFVNRASPLIASVEERAENQHFERIDLNNRWGGLAILEAHTLSALDHLPEGWDMASALLRQAVQDAVPLVQMKQNLLQNGDVRKMQDAGDLAQFAGVTHGASVAQPQRLESVLFRYPTEQILPHIWTVSWGRLVAEWFLPLSAISTLLLSLANLPVAACCAAILAVFSAFARGKVRLVEYHPEKPDILEALSWTVLAAAIFAVLNFGQFVVFDAAFLAFVLIGLCLLTSVGGKASVFTFLSPLTIALGLLLGSVMGAVDFGAKALILLEIANQLRLAILQRAKIKASD